MALGGDAAQPLHPTPRARNAGFTLLLISLLLFIAALIGIVAVPRWQAARRETRARETVAALKQFAGVFQQFANDHGDWPAAVNDAGTYPAGMEATLGPAWKHVTPIGGHYAWLIQTAQRGERVRAAIGIVSAGDAAVTRDRRQLDEVIRQGRAVGIEAHRLRLGYRDQPVYILEH